MHLVDSVKREKIDDIEILTVKNQFAEAQVSLFGGHLLSFKPRTDNRERLWLSEKAIFNNSKPIRGGVPVCWPWFSDSHNQPDADLPSHGWVRNQAWDIIETRESAEGTYLLIAPNTSNGPGFQGQATLKLSILVGKTLTLDLITENVGEQAFSFTCALHTYFSVKDIEHTQLSGLDGVYKDKTRNWQTFDTPTPYIFNSETDRVHLSTPKRVHFNADEDNQTQVFSHGHDSLVVWNPWQQNSIKMADMADDSFKTMLCVETAVTQGKTLQSGERHSLRQIIG